MKFIALSIALVSFSAFACPDLSGEYSVCRSKNNISIEGVDMVVAQSMNGNIHRYELEFLADGYTQRSSQSLEASGVPVTKTWVSDTGVKFVSVVKSWCVQNTLYVDTAISAYGGNWKSDLSKIRKVGNSLVIESEGQIVAMPFKDTLTCY